MEEPSPIENEEEIDDEIRNMGSHEIQCEKEYWNDHRTDIGTLFFPDMIVMGQHSLTHFPSQLWCKVHESIRGLNDKQQSRDGAGECHSTRQCVISTIYHGEQVDHRNTGKCKSKHGGKGKCKYEDVV